jgi:hypothetical protein
VKPGHSSPQKALSEIPDFHHPVDAEEVGGPCTCKWSQLSPWIHLWHVDQTTIAVPDPLQLPSFVSLATPLWTGLPVGGLLWHVSGAGICRQELCPRHADYYKELHTVRVRPDVQPGFLRPQLPPAAPEKGEHQIGSACTPAPHVCRCRA